MRTFLVIKDGIIINKVIAESKEIAEELTGNFCVEGESELYYFYNEETGEITPPPPGDDTPLPEPEIFSAPTEA